MSSAWQYPYVNLFKHCGVGQWKKCSKEGDVTAVMERSIKATVYRISGSIPSGNYIQLPKTSSQSLGLTGQFLFLVFRPQSSKCFVIHLEVATATGLAIRISFSNLFKEFKSTSTWLQLPFTAGSYEDNAGTLGKERCPARPSPASARWTLLVLDLRSILSKHLHTKFAYLKNVKICANLLIKNIFTSDIEYSPVLADTTNGQTRALPREMALPLTKGQDFSDVYDYIRFPSQVDSTGNRLPSHRPLRGQLSGAVHVDTGVGRGRDGGRFERRSLKESSSRVAGKSKLKESRSTSSALAKHHSTKSGNISLGDGGGGDRVLNVEGEGERGVHVYAERGAEVTIHHEREGERRELATSSGKSKLSESTPKRNIILKSSGPKKPEFQSLEPDPILSLQKVIGFGGCTTGQVLFGSNGCSVVYPCHSLVVDMEIKSGRQRFFIGHTDKVSCLALNHTGSLLASGQTGPLAVVRLWRFDSRQCLALFKTHHHGLHTLSFSHSGGVLCGAGRGGHGKTLVVLWNTSQVGHSGEVSVLAKAHTDTSIERMRIAAFDDSRMVSCGWDNIRFWRVRGGSLRSCPVNLEEHHQMHFTDVTFEAGYRNETDFTDRNVYACTKNGYLFEIHYKRISVRRVWHLLPSNTTGGVAINALCLHEAFCVTGSEDGFLRLWPLDFSGVFLEAEHEGAVTAVSVSEDGMKVLAGTNSGNIGLLDAGSRSYSTLMRSHTGTVQCMGLSPSRKQLVTCSTDHTIRVWDLEATTQLFDFRAPGEAPCCVSCHPSQQVFACGFQTGVVRVFHIPSTTLLAEHKQHHGSVTGLVFSLSGCGLYSSSASGSLAMYDTEHQDCRLLRLLGNTVAKGTVFGPQALALSEDGKRLAFIGPLEFTITVLDASSLDEVLRLDITSMAPSPSASHSVDPARLVCYAPRALDQLVVVTETSRLLKFSASSGQLLNEVSHIHRGGCTALSVGKGGRYLLTAGDKVIKVWDYRMALDLNFQVFIGHSEPVSQLSFSPDGSRVVSCGDAIFIWDFLAHQHPGTPPSPPSTPPRTSHSLTGMRSVSPRKRAPAPIGYEPLKTHSFTPLAPTPGHRNRGPGGQAETKTGSNLPMKQSEGASAPLSVDDERLYHEHSGSEEGGVEEEAGEGERTGKNINHFKQCARRRNSGSDSEGEGGSEDGGGAEEGGRSESDEEIVIEHSPNQEVEVVVEPPEHSSGSPRPLLPEDRPPSSSLGEPKALKHYRHHPPQACPAPHLYVAPRDQAGMKRRRVLGLGGGARGNLIWQPATGLFVYSSGCVVIVEDLSNGQQRHFTGHVEEVSTLAAQHDGQVLASASPAFGSTPCEIRIWKTDTGKCSKVLTFHSHAVTCMDYSRDDRFLLSMGTFQENALAVWNSDDYSLLTATNLSQAVHGLQWDPSTAYEFTTVGAGGSIVFWLLEEEPGGRGCKLKTHEPEVPAELPQEQPKESLEFTSLCYGRDSTLFIGSNTGLVTLWDTIENRCVMYWKTGASEIGAVLYSGGKLLTGNTAGSLQLWLVDITVSPPAVTMETAMEMDGGVFSVAFDAKMELGLVGTTAGTVWYVSWPERSHIKLVSGHAEQVSGVAFSVGGSHLASCSLDGSLAVWSLDTMEQLVLFQAPKKACTCVAFSPSVTTAADRESTPGSPSPLPHLVTGYNNGSLRVFDVERARAVQKMQPHAAPVRAVTYSTDGHVIISGCSDGMVAISNPYTGLVVRVVSDHQGAPITDLHTASKPVKLPGVGVEECHLWLVASGDRRVSVWGGEWGREVCQLVDWLTFPGPAFAPDGNRLKKGPKCQYELLPPSLARFSPSDPDTVIYAGYGMERCVQFYSLSQKAVVRTAALTHWATAMDVSPQGHLLAFGCKERVVKLMDFEEGSFQDYTGHSDSIGSVHFSPCGRLLVSTSHSSIHVWDVLLQ